MTAGFGPLFKKELLDLARNREALLPVVLVAVATLVLPFTVTVVLPAMTGHPLSADDTLLKVSAVSDVEARLAPDARVQLFLFQQFLMLFLVMPITGAMSLAAHSIVGEKLARTLEPLLATPIGTIDLLVAKVLGALTPTLAISAAGLVVYFAGIALTAEPGVLHAMMSARTFVLIAIIGPASALVSLQGVVLISSRVNDPRTAQQFGVLIVLPLTGLLVAQFTGSLWLSTSALAAIGVGLLVVWIFLTLFSVAMFEREAILTRWR